MRARELAVWVASAAAVVTAAPASRADDTAECIAAHVEAQRLERDRNVRAARDRLVQCSRPQCPKIVLEECTTMLAAVEQAIPTVVFEARDAQGRDVATAQVQSRGRVLSQRLDGKATEVDPGEHVFRFEAPGQTPVETRLIVREGDKGRRVAVTFAAPPPQPTGAGRRIPPLAWVAGGVGVLGLSLFGAFAIAGLGERSEVDDLGCKPNCPTDEVDDARNLFLAADVALVIGLAGLAAAPIIYFASEPSAVAKADAARNKPTRAAGPKPSLSFAASGNIQQIRLGARF